MNTADIIAETRSKSTWKPLPAANTRILIPPLTFSVASGLAVPFQKINEFIRAKKNSFRKSTLTSKKFQNVRKNGSKDFGKRKNAVKDQKFTLVSNEKQLNFFYSVNRQTLFSKSQVKKTFFVWIYLASKKPGKFPEENRNQIF